MVTALKRGDGVEMSKLEIEILARLTGQVFFGLSQLFLSMIEGLRSLFCTYTNYP